MPKDRKYQMNALKIKALQTSKFTEIRSTNDLEFINSKEPSATWRLDGIDDDPDTFWFEEVLGEQYTEHYLPASCMAGKIGDRLWVQEAIIKHANIRQVVGYVADGCYVSEHWEKRIPASKMPKWACRYVLEIQKITPTQHTTGMWYWAIKVNCLDRKTA